jgi:adenylate cyclase
MKSARRANIGWLAHAILASALGHLGKLDEARKAGGDTLDSKPDFTLSFITRTIPFKNPAHLEYFLGGLRKAGLPE